MDTSNLSGKAGIATNKKKQKQMKPSNITINTGSSTLMAPGVVIGINSGLQTAQTHVGDHTDNSFNQIDTKKKTPTNNATTSLNQYYIGPTKKVRTIGGSSGANTTMKQLISTNPAYNSKVISQAKQVQNMNSIQKQATRSVSSKKEELYLQQFSKNMGGLKQGLVCQPGSIQQQPSTDKQPQQIILQPKVKAATKNHKNVGKVKEGTIRAQFQSNNFQQRTNFSNDPQFGGQDPIIKGYYEEEILTDLKHGSTQNERNMELTSQQAQLKKPAQKFNQKKIETFIQQRNTSGYSAKIGRVNGAGNMTSTSACNQSFQFGCNPQVGQTLLSLSSRGRGGSSGSNPRAQGRYKSGSNKSIIKSKEPKKHGANLTTSNQKGLKNPKITINTNKAQIVLEPKSIGREIMTTKTTLGGQQIQPGSTKNKEKQVRIDMKNVRKPKDEYHSKNRISDLKIHTNATQQSRYDNFEIYNQNKDTSVEINTSKHNNIFTSLNFHRGKESLTTKNANSSVTQPKNEQNFDTTVKHQIYSNIQNSLRKPNKSTQHSAGLGHSNLLNKLGKQNIVQTQEHLKHQQRQKDQFYPRKQEKNHQISQNVPKESILEKNQMDKSVHLQSMDEHSDAANYDRMYYQTISQEKNANRQLPQQKAESKEPKTHGMTGPKQKVRKSVERNISSNFNTFGLSNQRDNPQSPKSKKATSQNPMKQKPINFVNNANVHEEKMNQSMELYDKKSQGSQRSKYSKQSKQSKHSNAIQNMIGKMIQTQNVQIQNLNKKINNNYKTEVIYGTPVDKNKQMAKQEQKAPQVKAANQGSQKMKMKKNQKPNGAIETGQGCIEQKLSNSKKQEVKGMFQKQTSSKGSSNQSQSLGHSRQQLQKMQQLSAPNLNIHESFESLQDINNVQQNDISFNTKKQIPQKKDSRFYEDELKKRDEIVLMLYKKMQGMESQIDLLKNHHNSSVQNGLAGGPSIHDSREMEMMVSSQPNSNYVGDEGGISNDMIDYISKMIKTNSACDRPIDNQQKLATQLMNKVFTIHKNSMESTDNEVIQQLKLKLNETSETGDIEHDQTDQLQFEFELDNMDEEDEIRVKSQQRIENVFKELEGKLEKFKKFNNPKRIADLRKFCATSITMQSKNKSDEITSRLLDSNQNSGRAGIRGSNQTISKILTTGRHYQSTSEADQNSLITIIEDVHLYKRTSNRISEVKNQAKPITEDSKKQIEKQPTQSQSQPHKSIFSKFTQKIADDSLLETDILNMVDSSNALNNGRILNTNQKEIEEENPFTMVQKISMDDLNDLEKLMNIQNEEDNPIDYLSKIWRDQQEKPDNQNEMSDMKMGSQRPMIQTQKIKFDSKMMIEETKGEATGNKKMKPRVGPNLDLISIKNVSKLNMKHSPNYIVTSTTPQNQQPISNQENLSKTLSKETLIQKFKKANIKNIGLIKPKINIQKIDEVKQKIKVVHKNNGENKKTQAEMKIPKFKFIMPNRNIQRNNFLPSKTRDRQTEEDKQNDSFKIISLERRHTVLDEQEKVGTIFQIQRAPHKNVLRTESNQNRASHRVHENVFSSDEDASPISGRRQNQIPMQRARLQGQGQGKIQSDRSNNSTFHIAFQNFVNQ